MNRACNERTAPSGVCDATGAEVVEGAPDGATEVDRVAAEAELDDADSTVEELANGAELVEPDEQAAGNSDTASATTSKPNRVIVRSPRIVTPGINCVGCE